MNDKVCPTCGQPLPQSRGRRICADCRQPIRRHDKWFIGDDGKLHHKDCDNPEGSPMKPVASTSLPFTSTLNQGEHPNALSQAR